MVQPLLETLIDTHVYVHTFYNVSPRIPPPGLGYNAGCYIVIFWEAFVFCPVINYNLVKCQPFSFLLKMLCRILGDKKKKKKSLKRNFSLFSLSCVHWYTHYIFFFFLFPHPFPPHYLLDSKSVFLLVCVHPLCML